MGIGVVRMTDAMQGPKRLPPAKPEVTDMVLIQGVWHPEPPKKPHPPGRGG